MNPTYILGLNSFHADSGAALVCDGELVAAVTDERLNRVKHFAGFPAQSIREVLDLAGIGIQDVAHIGINKDNRANLAAKLGFAFRNLTRITKLARQRLEYRAQAQDAPQQICDLFGIARNDLRAEIHNIEHHLCHAASTFYVSNFEDAAILSIDGFGDFASTVTAHGRGNEISILDRTLFPHSMGIVYTMICQFIGYDRYGDEGKVMGLAPYGSPTYGEFFEKLVILKPRGRFELNLSYFQHHTEGVDYTFDEKGKPTVAPLFSEAMIKEFGQPRERNAELTDRDNNLAASLQQCLERVYFHILSHLYAETKVDRLCLAGGVALNSVANGQIFTRSPFRYVYTQPAASDDGTAVGAAYHIYHSKLGRPREFFMDHAYTGREFTDEQIATVLEGNPAITFERVVPPKLYELTARAIAAGQIVGWFQGRMEWGPRALGNRSIVAHPGLPDMKDTLNSRIKHREWFRPFAPSILADRVGEFFEETHPSPFMMFVYKIRPEVRDKLCAINHVDNTGRLQTVSREQNTRYYELIKAFEAETGLPVVLNTSFNENEPIVCTPTEALDCFLRTRMDLLVMGDFMVHRLS